MSGQQNELNTSQFVSVKKLKAERQLNTASHKIGLKGSYYLWNKLQEQMSDKPN